MARLGVLEQGGANLADEALHEIAQLLLAEAQHLLCAPVGDIGGNLAFQLQGACAGTLAVDKDMEAAEGQRAAESEALGKAFVRLAAGADNEVYANKGVGNKLLYLFDFMAEEGGVVAAAHQPEHRVRTALQGYVEMRHEALRRRAELDERVGQEIGFDGRYAVALDAIHLIQSAA